MPDVRVPQAILLLSLNALRLAAQTAESPQLLPGVEIARLAEGHRSLEGPAWHPSGEWLVFSDQDAGREYRWDASTGVSERRALGGKVNGHAFDLQGRLITCESAARRVTRGSADQGLEVLADAGEDGLPLNAPNDVAVHPKDGAIWFTDPNFGLGKEGADRQYLYRIDPDSGAVRRALPDSFNKPNGLDFSEDGRTLYLVVGSSNEVRAYPVGDSGLIAGDHRVLARGLDRWPDGLAVQAGTGWIFVALYSSRKEGPDARGLDVFTPEGVCIGRIPLPGTTTNLAFHPGDPRSLVVTSGGQLFSLRLPEPDPSGRWPVPSPVEMRVP